MKSPTYHHCPQSLAKRLYGLLNDWESPDSLPPILRINSILTIIRTLTTATPQIIHSIPNQSIITHSIFRQSAIF
ncbi:hypothetical protein FGO68_gene13418 [Halteria grandinella]|uniref:Uncharacterized protein n=1 Tax=Halteria grandinella TaxID=5974 RepID=A0A8J8N9Q6_HALGN|nr:hypothetical protein FGO68_gene13418 [Halteria grandinella]